MKFTQKREEIQKEALRLNVAILNISPGKRHVALYAAQQALAWVLGEGDSAHQLIMGPEHGWFGEEVCNAGDMAEAEASAGRFCDQALRSLGRIVKLEEELRLVKDRLGLA